MAERDCRPLQVEENAASASGRNALIQDGLHDGCECLLDFGKRVHVGKAGSEDVGTTDDAGGVLAIFLVALMEVAEFLTAKGGRAAGGAIFFEMVTSTDDHKNLLTVSSQPSAISCKPRRVDAGCGYSRSKVEQRSSG